MFLKRALIGFLLLTSVSGFSQELAGSHEHMDFKKASFSLKTAPIRYLYGINFEVEFALTEKISLGAGFQNYQRDFVLPAESYNSDQFFYHFTLYEGLGNRILLEGRWYNKDFPQSKIYSYFGWRLYGKTFSFSEPLAKMGNENADYYINYREEQNTYGTQIIWGGKITDTFGDSHLFYEVEGFVGVGVMYMERRTRVEIPDNLFVPPGEYSDFQVHYNPQLTFGVLLGLGY